MQYQDFIEGVQKSGNFSSVEEAEIAVEASLSTQAERLHTTVIDKFQSQLPKQLKNIWPLAQTASSSRWRSTINGFGRGPCSVFSGSTLSWAVMNMVTCNTTGQNEILNDLPAEFAELFGQEPTTPLSPTVME